MLLENPQHTGYRMIQPSMPHPGVSRLRDTSPSICTLSDVDILVRANLQGGSVLAI